MLLPMVAWISRSLPSRLIFSRTLSPGIFFPRSSATLRPLSTAWPSISRISSPTFKPAFSAPVPGKTCPSLALSSRWEKAMPRIPLCLSWRGRTLTTPRAITPPAGLTVARKLPTEGVFSMDSRTGLSSLMRLPSSWSRARSCCSLTPATRAGSELPSARRHSIFPLSSLALVKTSPLLLTTVPRATFCPSQKTRTVQFPMLATKSLRGPRMLAWSRS